MISTKPYLVRAIFEWCVDQGFVPYLSVVVDSRTRVPREHVKDGQITLNIGPDATHQLMMGNEEITFQARFSGNAFPVAVPIDRVAAIFARENGQGMAFEIGATEDEEETAATEAPAAEPAGATEPVAAPPERPAGGRPHLTRIK
ncbi:MAG: ClpXP protease specificity-enhancing factor [Sterolibacteriaceae bacterium MAG5]|nr:ClpXP protease specificity-enhancing factor [Candidatus Nitricoxidireducens bremensis]